MSMQYRQLGDTSTEVSVICLGTMTYGNPNWRPWVLEEDASRPFIKEALEAGINFFDTADIYSIGGSEEILGRALKDMAKRDEVVIATKLFGPMGPGRNQRGLSRKHVMEGVDASLKRLGLDYIDHLVIHRHPHGIPMHVATPIEETLEALHDVVKAGKALYLGASSMFAWQFTELQLTAKMNGWTPFISMQNHYNLIYREEEREMNPYCAKTGVALMPWSPLARGILAGSYKGGFDAGSS